MMQTSTKVGIAPSRCELTMRAGLTRRKVRSPRGKEDLGKGDCEEWGEGTDGRREAQRGRVRESERVRERREGEGEERVGVGNRYTEPQRET